MQSQEYISLALTSTDTIFTLLLLLMLSISYSLFHNAFAASPPFDQIFITDEETSNQTNDWVQTYGNDSTHLRSDHVNLLAVDYVSDGNTLDTTLWLASNLENASTYSQPLKKIRYGMLIAIASLPPTSGYSGANYNFYIEEVDGKWSEYLYQLSSTGSSALIGSKINYTESFDGPTVGPGYVKLRLNLSSINNPTAYGLSFYTAESDKSNEVRDFTNWIAIPPATIDMSTSPENIVMRQGEKRLVTADVDTPFSNNVTSITFVNGTDYSSNGLNVTTQSIQPPLFEVGVSPQTPIGAYHIPFVASMLISTTSTTSTYGPVATATFDTGATGVVDPEFQVSKKYPTVGHITGPGNLTVNVIAPLTVNEIFLDFWTTYATTIAIVLSGMVGVLMTFIVDHMRRRKEHKQSTEHK